MSGRVRAYTALRKVADTGHAVLSAGGWWGVQGGRGVEGVRMVMAAARLAMEMLDPSGDWVVVPAVLGDIAASYAGIKPPTEQDPVRWASALGGHLVVKVSSGAVYPSTRPVLEYRWSGSLAELGEAVGREVARRMPHAILGRSGIEADRPSLVRRLTKRESAVEATLAKYMRIGCHRSVLLFGPRGSAKTSLACSVSSRLVGSYLRVPSDAIDEAMVELLGHMRVQSVVLDDLDRHEGNSLELLERLNAAVPLVWITVNDAGELDSALTRPGRADLVFEVAGDDDEARAEVMAAAGLEGVEFGSAGGQLLAAEVLELGRRHRAGDLDDPPGAAAELVDRRERWSLQLRT